MMQRPHRFSVGQMVEIMPTTLRAAAPGRYRIMRLVPCEADDPQYRVKSEDENYERVLPERDLIPLDKAS